MSANEFLSKAFKEHPNPFKIRLKKGWIFDSIHPGLTEDELMRKYSWKEIKQGLNNGTLALSKIGTAQGHRKLYVHKYVQLPQMRQPAKVFSFIGRKIRGILKRQEA